MSDMEDLEEIDFEFEDEDDIEQQPDNIAEFGAYRDIGAEGRLGGVMDEDIDINRIEGAQNQILDPKSIFTLRMLEELALLSDRLVLNDQDVKALKQGIHGLHFIRLKNALAYIIGYYLYKHENASANVSVIKNLLKNELSDDKHVTMYECLKYGRYWATVGNVATTKEIEFKEYTERKKRREGREEERRDEGKEDGKKEEEPRKLKRKAFKPRTIVSD